MIDLILATGALAIVLVYGLIAYGFVKLRGRNDERIFSKEHKKT